MKYIGIDYGAKRIGIAVSDDDGIMAFPRKVIENDHQAILNINNFCKEEEVEHIVLGKSIDEQGNNNIIMGEIEIFKKKIEEQTHLPVSFVDESMSTLHALGSIVHKPTARFPKKKKEKNDAEAATLILQRFLELQK
ncbi:MAG: putative Holliday junction resolvase [Flavobacteriaceae bacterium]|jgi:putative Holliday junction resolvase